MVEICVLKQPSSKTYTAFFNSRSSNWKLLPQVDTFSRRYRVITQDKRILYPVMKDNQSKDSEAESARQFPQNLPKTIFLSSKHNGSTAVRTMKKVYLIGERQGPLRHLGVWFLQSKSVVQNIDLDLHVSVESLVGE